MSKPHTIKTLVACLWAALGVMFCSSSIVFAVTYKSSLNFNSWKSSSSVMRCRIVQKIPMFGEAVIQKRAGEASSLYFTSKLGRLKAGKAKLVALSPVWSPDHVEVDMGAVSIKSGRRLLSLNSSKTETLIKKLNNGFEVGVTQNFSSGDTEAKEVKVVLNTVGFQREYRKYQSCLPRLIPRNFDQLKRTSLYFAERPDKIDSYQSDLDDSSMDPPREELSESAMKKLDHILTLAQHDKKLQEFYVDGHTDSIGVRTKNLEVSKERAEIVAGYLTSRGISKEMVKVRWHGERYPVSSNDTKAGRAKNRRVTLRLERADKPKASSVVVK